MLGLFKLSAGPKKQGYREQNKVPEPVLLVTHAVNVNYSFLITLRSVKQTLCVLHIVQVVMLLLKGDTAGENSVFACYQF